MDCHTTGHSAATSTRPSAARYGTGTRVPFSTARMAEGTSRMT
ncbi:hypothetical protein [Streptomyces sp. NPDC008240]